MLCVVAGYIALFVWLAIRRYEACLTQSGDTTVFECAFYNTLSGGNTGHTYRMYMNMSGPDVPQAAHVQVIGYHGLPLGALERQRHSVEL